MEFKGTIKTILPAVHGEYNGNANCRRQVILESEPNEKGYTDEFLVELYKTGDYIKFIDTEFDFNEGDKVKCEIGGRVREHNGRNYGNLNTFKLELDLEDAPF